MHASTRILVLLLAGAALVVGWWLLAISNTIVPAVAFAALWAAVVLGLAFAIIKVGAAYNRLSARRRPAVAGLAVGAGLDELEQLRRRGLISEDEYGTKRQQAIDRL